MKKKIFLWTITLAGFAILFWIFSLMIESRLAIKWPHTKGKMISSLLFINHIPGFINPNADPMRWYGADVQYEYSVGNIPYISDRLSFEVLGTRSAKTALKEMNKYRHLHEVTVYYDPTNPQQAVLEPANFGDVLIPFVVGGLLVFWGLVFLYDQSIVVKSRGMDEHLWSGNSYLQQGKLHEALYEYNQIIKMSPYLAQGYKSRGNLYFQQGYWDQAIADFNQAISIDPTDAFIHFNRANAYLGKKQYDKAWEGMQKAIGMGFNVKPEILEEIKKGL